MVQYGERTPRLDKRLPLMLNENMAHFLEPNDPCLEGPTCTGDCTRSLLCPHGISRMG
jgi:hypothetical protein